MRPQAESRALFRKTLLRASSLSLLASLSLFPLVAQAQGTGIGGVLAPKLFSQPAGEDVAEGRYLSAELEAKLLADPEMAGSQPTLEFTGGTWILKGQFNKQSARLRARELVTEATGSAPTDKSKVVIYPTPTPKPLSAAATKVLAQRTLREKFPSLIGNIQCESTAEGVIRLEGSTLSVEDKLEVLRGMHRAKGVRAVEGVISISPMLRSGKKVYLVSSQGDVVLEKLPNFQPAGERINGVLPAVGQPKPSVRDVPPLPADFPPPPQAFNRPASPEIPVGPEKVSPPTPATSITRTTEPPLAPEAVSAANFSPPAPSSGLAGDAVRVKTVPVGQLSHPGRSWNGPSSVLVGGQPIHPVHETPENAPGPWATAHQPARTLQAQLAWREKVQTVQVAKTNSGGMSYPNPGLEEPRRAPVLVSTPSHAPLGAPVTRVETSPLNAKDPTQALGINHAIPAVTVVNPSSTGVVRNGPVRAVSLLEEGAEETNAASSVKTMRARLVLDEEIPVDPAAPKNRKFSKADVESAVRIACAGLAQKVEIIDQDGVTLVRVTTTSLAAERKALEALVLLPEIHDAAVKLEVKTAN